MRKIMNCPGKAATSGRSSAGISENDFTVALSFSIRDTRKGRKPTHAGGGPLDSASPAFPAAAPAVSSCSSSAWNDSFHPALSAGMRRARSH